MVDRLSSEIAKITASLAFQQKAAEQGTAADFMDLKKLGDYSKSKLVR